MIILITKGIVNLFIYSCADDVVNRNWQSALSSISMYMYILYIFDNTYIYDHIYVIMLLFNKYFIHKNLWQDTLVRTFQKKKTSKHSIPF